MLSCFPFCAGMCWTSCATTRAWRPCTPWSPPAPARCVWCCGCCVTVAAGAAGVEGPQPAWHGMACTLLACAWRASTCTARHGMTSQVDACHVLLWHEVTWQCHMAWHGMACRHVSAYRCPTAHQCPTPASSPQFCLTYKRTTEFRRLCDIVRNHLSNLLKYRDQGGRDRTDLKCGGWGAGQAPAMARVCVRPRHVHCAHCAPCQAMCMCPSCQVMALCNPHPAPHHALAPTTPLPLQRARHLGAVCGDALHAAAHRLRPGAVGGGVPQVRPWMDGRETWLGWHAMPRGRAAWQRPASVVLQGTCHVMPPCWLTPALMPIPPPQRGGHPGPVPAGAQGLQAQAGPHGHLLRQADPDLHQVGVAPLLRIRVVPVSGGRRAYGGATAGWACRCVNGVMLWKCETVAVHVVLGCPARVTCYWRPPAHSCTHTCSPARPPRPAQPVHLHAHQQQEPGRRGPGHAGLQRGALRPLNPALRPGAQLRHMQRCRAGFACHVHCGGMHAMSCHGLPWATWAVDDVCMNMNDRSSCLHPLQAHGGLTILHGAASTSPAPPPASLPPSQAARHDADPAAAAERAAKMATILGFNVVRGRGGGQCHGCAPWDCLAQSQAATVRAACHSAVLVRVSMLTYTHALACCPVGAPRWPLAAVARGADCGH